VLHGRIARGLFRPRPASRLRKQAAAPRDAATAAAIERVLSGEHRSAGNRARDTWRHPLDTLLFFGIKPDMTVVEVWPGAGGWYTEVLAPLLTANGKLYAAQMPADPGNTYATATLATFAAKLEARPDLYGKVTVTTLGPGGGDIAPPGSCDLVLTFRNLHNWMNQGYAPDALAAMNRALKPGWHPGYRGTSRRPGETPGCARGNGYVNEQYRDCADRVGGFRARGALGDQRPIRRDTKDYEQGVWSLPPTYRQGSRDRAKFEAIGESDRFTLKFRKK
jgi:predicted methyltransferase